MTQQLDHSKVWVLEEKFIKLDRVKLNLTFDKRLGEGGGVTRYGGEPDIIRIE